MIEYVERRRCRRFEIPDAKVRYKKIGLLVFRKASSTTYPVVNVSKGGLGFVCDEKFRQGQKVMLQLLAPKETPLNLLAQIRWQGQVRADTIVGVKFMRFGWRKGLNSMETLDVLRRLEAQHGKGEKED